VWSTPLDSTLLAERTPLAAALRLARTAGLAWLDGGLEHGREGRFSFVSTAPCEVVEQLAPSPCPLSLLDRLGSPAPASLGTLFTPAEVPLWVGHVTYDALAPRPHDALAQHAVPALRFARYDAWYAFDHQDQRAYLVGDDRAACERLAARLQAAPLTSDELRFESKVVEVTPAEQHRTAVRQALALIREGELYEINLARRFRASFSGSALGLFLRMRSASPVPLGYFVDAPTHAIAGRSMERFLRYRADDRSLFTSPIKGTIARVGDDLGEAAALRADPKERAEHAMVVDLMRNDLSRVCNVGSVEVSELMAVLPFAGLSHLVSTVRGTVRPEVTLRTLLEHTLPPGSVTGTPKLRVLQAIAALETAARGVYTGCVGFVDRAGGCSLAVAIRTAVVADGWVHYAAGGGIVADSDPERETAETELKAHLFLEALRAERESRG
jgi:anthranilate/para-aminobenzoate synthase component I